MFTWNNWVNLSDMNDHCLLTYTTVNSIHIFFNISGAYASESHENLKEHVFSVLQEMVVYVCMLLLCFVYIYWAN